jgi:hypothetical protein
MNLTNLKEIAEEEKEIAVEITKIAKEIIIDK